MQQQTVKSVVLAGLSGGSGKSVVSVGLIAALRRRQHGVVAFKKGPDYIDAGWLGGLRRDADFALPERHLGLTVASELPDAMARLDALADAMSATPLGRLDATGWQRWTVSFTSRRTRRRSAISSARCFP